MHNYLKRQANTCEFEKNKRNKYLYKVLMTMVCTLFVCTFLCACNENNDNNNEISIVTTVFPAYDFARQLSLDNANIELIIKPGSEVHSYEPSPQDIIKISECDLFIYTGGENDEWVEEILDSIESDKIVKIKMIDSVDLVEEEVIEGMKAEEEHGHDGDRDGDHDGDDHETEWDEHVWTSPQNAIKICQTISYELVKLDTNNQDLYRAKLKDYIQKLEKLDNDIRDVLINSKRDVLLFADRFPARYFVEEYNLKYYAAFPGCSSETEPNASVIAFLIDKIKDEEIPAIFKIELSNGNVADVISEETGTKVLTFSSCHNITKEEYSSGKTYIDIMYENIEALKEALN